MAQKSLVDELADALPENSPFTLYHIATPPEACDPIYRALPSKNPDKTFCESHFLNVAITPDASNTNDQHEELLVMAIECLIYSTKRLTTIFVSKADSTGHLHFLNLPVRSYDSPLRTIASTFISHLARHRARLGIPCVIDLFARASNQYLFPRSVKNPTKHVSDDRQLVKWWLRVLDPIVQEYAAIKPQGGLFMEKSEAKKDETTAQAYLLVPGEESVTSFLPQNTRFDSARRARWTHGHPLRQINRAEGPNVPPRCLIPIFPDDPKGRFCTDLDEELPDGASSADGSPTKRGTGIWNSAKTLEQFWDLMAFRAECSSGRLVGFIWIVIQKPEDKKVDLDGDTIIQDEGLKSGVSGEDISFTSTSSISEQPSTNLSTPRPKARRNQKHNRSGRKDRQPRMVLSGPITPRLPRIKTAAPALSKLRNDAKYYLYGSPHGNLILDQKSYERAVQVLLDLDFGGREASAKSTKAWIEQVSVLAGKGRDLGWGDRFIGKQKPIILAGDASTTQTGATTLASTASVNVLGVKKKRKAPNTGFDEMETGESQAAKKARSDEVIPLQTTTAPTVNVLNGGFIRKKAKLVPPSSHSTFQTPQASENTSKPPEQPAVNLLNPSLIRKNKRKPEHLEESSSGADDTSKRVRIVKEDTCNSESTSANGGTESMKRKVSDEAVNRVESSMKRVRVSPSKTLGENGTKKQLKRKAMDLSDDEEVLAMEKETKVRLIT